MLLPASLPPLAIDPAGWLAPLGVAVLTFTLLRRYRVRMGGRRKAARKPAALVDPAAAVRTAVGESAGAWELRLHDAGRAAEASLETRVATLDALAERADAAADRLRNLSPSEGPQTIPLPHASLPDGDERTRRHLRQAGYDDRQIDVILARDGDGERRRAA